MKPWLWIGVLGVLVWANQAPAAVYLLEIDGVKGDSRHPGYTNWIEVNAFGVEFFNSGGFPGGGGGGAGKAGHANFKVAGQISNASPRILENLLLGRSIQSVQLDILMPTLDELNLVASWTMEDVLITRYSTSGSGGLPTENYEFDFRKITYQYYAPKGGVSTASWDFSANTTSFNLVGDDFQFLTGTLPEPATAWLLLTLGGAALLRRRRN